MFEPVYISFFQLSAEQCSEMREYRQRAVQLELDMQSKQRNKLLARVQDILDQAQVSSTVWSWSQAQVWSGRGIQWIMECKKVLQNQCKYSLQYNEQVKSNKVGVFHRKSRYSNMLHLDAYETVHKRKKIFFIFS